jgi:uncharacterized membrane protein YkvA (DUF1232 family)
LRGSRRARMVDSAAPGARGTSPPARTRSTKGTMATQAKDQKRRRRGPSLLGRALGIMAFLPLASRAPIYARLIFALVLDERTPASRKALLAGAAGYLIVGRDLIPDDIPILGGLDDLVVVVLAVDLFLDGVPSELLTEKLQELGIDRVAFDQDMARVRRLTPGPVRKTLRRIPKMVSQAGDAIEGTGVGPRVRNWISKEDSIA